MSHAFIHVVVSGLHYACGRGDVDLVEAMISCGAEIDALVLTLYLFVFLVVANALHQDQDGYTPLHIAAGYLHERVISVLMQSGADPSLEDNSGRSVFMHLISFTFTYSNFTRRLL